MADEPQAGGATTVPVAADPGPDTTAATENVTEEASKENGDKPTGGEEPATADDKPEQAQSAAPETADESKPADTTVDGNADEAGGDTTNAAGPADEEATGAEEPGPNGTPAAASSKAKKAGGNKRKSSGGPPEHRNKKLNKKKSIAKITHLDAQPGEFYFARQKGYAPWPAVICDEEMLPDVLLASRPTTAKQTDGTYKEPYADGGKRVQDRTFPVMYLHTNEFAWIPNTDLSPLDPGTCGEEAEKGKKNKLLVEAYKVAAENHDLQHFKDILAEHQRLLEEEIRAQEEREAEKQAKKDKKKRKSSATKGEDEDEGDETGGEKRKSSKKRKKDMESEGEDKPTKAPKSGPKLKLTTTPKTSKSAETGKKAGGSDRKAGAGKKGAKRSGSDDGDTAQEKPKKKQQSEKPVDPEVAKAKRVEEVWFLRHRLQKGFLSRDQAPQEEDMEIMSTYLDKLDSYEDLEISIIRSTKINKVLKGIIKLNWIPREEDYNFRGRSVNILGKWKRLLESDVPAPGANDEEEGTPAAKPTANGIKDKEATAEATEGETQDTDAAATEAKKKGDDVSESAAAPPKDVEMPDAPALEEKSEETADSAAADKAAAETAAES